MFPMNILQVYGYSLLIINIVIYLVGCCDKQLGNRINIFLSIFILLLVNFVPVFHGVSFIAFLNGCFADLSIMFIGVLTYILFAELLYNNSCVDKLFFPFVLITISLFGLILYLSATGLIKYDIYALGYNNSYFLLGFALLAIVSFYFSRLFAIIWLLAGVAFYLKLQTSSNLWDYLFDPFLWLWCLILLAQKIILLLKK